MKSAFFRVLFKSVLAGLAMLSLSAVLHSAQADEMSDIMARGVLRVGTLVDLPPFGMLDKNQQPIGFDIDLANMMAKDLGVKLQLIPVTGENRLPYLVTDKVDVIIGAFGATPERAKKIDFSSAYASNTIAVYGSTNVHVTAPGQLGTLKIGVARGTSEDISLTAMAPHANIIRYDTQATAVAAFLSGQVDLIACPNVVFNAVAQANPDRKMEQKFEIRFVTNHIAIRKGQLEFLRWIDTFIFYHKITGDLNQLSLKWLKSPLPDLPSM